MAGLLFGCVLLLSIYTAEGVGRYANDVHLSAVLENTALVHRKRCEPPGKGRGGRGGGGGGGGSDCGTQCPDDDFVECFQCGSREVEGCGPLDPTFTLGTSHVVYCKLSIFNCVFEDNVIDGEHVYTRGCQQKFDYIGWHNSTDANKLVCVTDRCNEAPTHNPQILLTATAFIITLRNIINVFWS